MVLTWLSSHKNRLLTPTPPARPNFHDHTQIVFIPPRFAYSNMAVHAHNTSTTYTVYSFMFNDLHLLFSDITLLRAPHDQYHLLFHLQMYCT